MGFRSKSVFFDSSSLVGKVLFGEERQFDASCF